MIERDGGAGEEFSNRYIKHNGVSLFWQSFKAGVAAGLAVLGGWQPVSVTEGARKGRDGGVAGAGGYFSDGLRRARELSGGAMEAQALDGGRRGFSVDAVIDAAPVIGREAGDFGETVEIELVLEMIVNVLRDSPEAVLIVDPRAGLFFSHSVCAASRTAFDFSCGVV